MCAGSVLISGDIRVAQFVHVSDSGLARQGAQEASSARHQPAALARRPPPATTAARCLSDKRGSATIMSPAARVAWSRTDAAVWFLTMRYLSKFASRIRDGWAADKRVRTASTVFQTQDRTPHEQTGRIGSTGAVQGQRGAEGGRPLKLDQSPTSN